jgi:Cu(I)/Ag(I) efflux system membrane fusion protein
MRKWLTLLAVLAVGLVIGASAVYAHFSGFFGPVYHLVGLHEMAKQAEQHQHAGSDAMSHTGHGGMAMPTEKGEPSQVSGYSIVKITPERQQLIGVRTGSVQRDRLIMSIRTVGIVEPDQTRLARIQTRIKGWVTKVHVNFVGQLVQKGDPLLEVYSPDLLSSQDQYLIALASLERMPEDKQQRRLVESSRRRLELLGVSSKELEQLDHDRTSQETLTLRAPITGRVLERHVLEGSYVEPAMELYQVADLSVVWLQAKIYEHELPHIEPNQPVLVTLPSQPDKLVNGKVSFVEPLLQETTRTVKVRVVIDNQDELLKPGMYADLRIEHDMGEGLLVSESAVLRTGERAIAFRALSGGRFEPIEVKLGSRFGDRFEVLSGLQAEDKVVTSGNFLIDSDSRLKAAVGGMTHAH